MSDGLSAAAANRGQENLPLALGSDGEAVADLQKRLARLGYSAGADAIGRYGEATTRAVQAFQSDRGLRVDGICGEHTWASLVEAGFELGDRVLYLRRPPVHGDDVAALQRQLSALGFDPGGVDGIFGAQTASALAAFQRNTGITSDGICGPVTLAELRRLSLRHGAEDLVTAVRERLGVGRASGSLTGRTVVIGESGGFQVGVSAVTRSLAAIGANPIPVHHPDEGAQAEAANNVRACCYVGLRLDPGRPGIRTAYYKGYRYESEASKYLAKLIVSRASAAMGLGDEGTEGMALPILRQTRMPAVVVELGSPPKVTSQVAEVAIAITGALLDWVGAGWA